MGGVVAVGKGEEPGGRGAATSQPSKAFICLVLKIKLVAELQMMLPSNRQTLNDIDSPSFPYNPARLSAEQDCESTIPISFPFIVIFETSLPELSCK